jgi:hypothetical protein
LRSSRNGYCHSFNLKAPHDYRYLVIYSLTIIY